MAIAIVGHLKDPPLKLSGVGKGGAGIYIRTGVLVFNLAGAVGEDWRREAVEVEVLDLPAGRNLVQAIATAAPASINYRPTPTGQMYASGPIFAAGWGSVLDHTVHVEVSGEAVLNVHGAPGDAGAGWAVDFAKATDRDGKVWLRADIAAHGAASLLRLCYTVFVVVTPVRKERIR